MEEPDYTPVSQIKIMTKKLYYNLLEETIKAIMSARPLLVDNAIDTRMEILSDVEKVFVKFGKKYLK